jgi:hypothetical protein
MVLNENNKWIQAKPSQKTELHDSKEFKQKFKFDISEYNKIIGFDAYEKSNKYLVFKTKDMTAKRDTGARCDEAGKDKTMKKLNEIIGQNKYTNESTKVKKDTDGNIIKEAIGQVELCVTMEFILRFYETIKKDGKKWFLTPEMAIYFKLYTIFV